MFANNFLLDLMGSLLYILGLRNGGGESRLFVVIVATSASDLSSHQGNVDFVFVILLLSSDLHAGRLHQTKSDRANTLKAVVDFLQTAFCLIDSVDQFDVVIL